MNCPLTLIFVRWIDSSSQSEPERAREVKLTPCEMSSAGILVAEDEHAMTLAQDHYPDHDGEGVYRKLLCIPKIAIVDLQRLTPLADTVNEPVVLDNGLSYSQQQTKEHFEKWLGPADKVVSPFAGMVDGPRNCWQIG